jgi:predicted nucleic acid-binding protein
VHSGPELVLVHAQLRVDCRMAGHALADQAHNADRWIAATAIRLGLPLLSNDGIFRGVSGLELETLSGGPTST